MVKMTQNLDTPCNMMILSIPKILSKFVKNGDFWQKNCCLLNFDGKCIRAQENGLIGLIFGINVPYKVLRTELGSFFWIFGVLAILWCLVCSNWAFWSNLNKKANFEHTATHKMAKTPNIPKDLPSSVLITLRYNYTKNQANYTIFSGPDTFSVENQ